MAKTIWVLLAVILMLAAVAPSANAAPNYNVRKAQPTTPLTSLENGLSGSSVEWQKIQLTYRLREREDYVNGLSYVISGAVAIAGGLAAQSVTNDPIEDVIYGVFQSVGIASIGYGAYMWQLGSEERMIYDTISRANYLDERDKVAVMRSYTEVAKERERKAKIIRAVTHGLIAAYSVYNGVRAENETAKNTYFFVGGVNLLASVSFAF